MNLSAKHRFDMLALAALVLGAAWIAITAPAPQELDAARAEPAQGFLAPDFTLGTLSGETLSLADQRGKAVLVNFWASWCAPCRAEMPAMQRVYEKYRDQGFIILAINLANQDGRAGAQAFVDEFGLTFPILLDVDGQVSAAYRLRSLPSSYFIDRNGVIQEVVLGGPMAEALILTRVEQLLGASQ